MTGIFCRVVRRQDVEDRRKIGRDDRLGVTALAGEARLSAAAALFAGGRFILDLEVA